MLKKFGKAMGKLIFSEKKEVKQQEIERYVVVPRKLTREEDEARYARLHTAGIMSLRMAQIEASQRGEDTRPFGRTVLF